MPSWLGKNHWEGRRQAGAGPDTRKVRDTLAGTGSFMSKSVICHVSPLTSHLSPVTCLAYFISYVG